MLGLCILDSHKVLTNGHLERGWVSKVDGIWSQDLGSLWIVKEGLCILKVGKDKGGAAIVRHDLHRIVRAECVWTKDGSERLFGLVAHAVEL